MSFAAELQTLKDQLVEHGVPVDAVLEKAGVDRSTWTRWNNRSVKSPHYDTWKKVSDAAALLAEQRGAA